MASFRYRLRLVSDALSALAALRDGLLVLSAVTYAVGYVVCSIAAHRNQLGLLPFLDAQYFVAGFAPLLTLGLVLLIIHWSRVLFLTHWPRFLAQRSITFQAVLAIIAFLIVITLPLVDSFLHAWTRRSLAVRTVVPILAMAILLAPTPGAFKAIIAVIRGRRADSVLVSGLTAIASQLYALQLQRLVVIYLVPLYFGALAVQLFVTEAYDRVPQTLGGAQPRCARLDVKVKELSPETLKAFGVAADIPLQSKRSGEQIAAASEVHQTKPLLVHFLGAQTVVLAVRDSKRAREVFEVSRDAVVTVRWCD